MFPSAAGAYVLARDMFRGMWNLSEPHKLELRWNKYVPPPIIFPALPAFCFSLWAGHKRVRPFLWGASTSLGKGGRKKTTTTTIQAMPRGGLGAPEWDLVILLYVHFPVGKLTNPIYATEVRG